MKICHEVVFEDIQWLLEKTAWVKQVAAAGFCREWSIRAIRILKSYQPNEISLKAKVMEVHLEPGLSHTFLEMEIECDDTAQIYILDGTGTAKFEPYSGLASNAPSHLRNSHIDPIQRYIDLNIGQED